MSASIKTTPDHIWTRDHKPAAHWDELPTDGSHAWVGLMLVLGSSIVAIRGLCWVAAQMIRLFH